MSRIRLGLLAASPMYYQAPLYRRIAADVRIDFEAIFASKGGNQPHDAGYGRPISWDLDALGGYNHRFLNRADSNPIDGSFMALHDFDVVNVIRQGEYDVLWLHGYNFLTHQLAAWTQILRRRRLLVREEQTLLHRRSPMKQLAKRIGLRALLSQANGLYIGSQNKLWFQRYGVPESRLFFTPYCVDNERFRSDASRLVPDREKLRRDLQIPPQSGPVITMVGRLIPKKQPQFLLEAFRNVRSRIECTLLIVGSGELEDELRATVKEQDIPDVVFAGFMNQSQVSKAYASSDIFVLPSAYDETWGLVTNEAMNFGLPVVVTDKVGCGVDLVRSGENGYIVPADDRRMLADRLEGLVRDAAMRSGYGQKSLEIVSGYNYDAAAAGVLEAVAAAVGPSRWKLATDFTHE